MNPATAMIMYGVGTGLQAYSQYQEGKEAEAIAKRNAAILAEQAERTKEVSREEAREHMREAERLKGRQIVAFAGSGVKAGTGTPLLVTKESFKQMGRQARVIMEGGEYESSYYQSQSELQKRMGRQAGKAALWKAGGTLATGFGTIGQMKYQYGSPKTKAPFNKASYKKMDRWLERP